MTKVNIEALALLPIANDLAYIMECLALDYTGEASTELNELLRKIKCGEHPAITAMMNAHIATLAEASGMVRGSKNSRKAAGLLSSFSRKLWHEILY